MSFSELVKHFMRLLDDTFIIKSNPVGVLEPQKNLNRINFKSASHL